MAELRDLTTAMLYKFFHFFLDDRKETLRCASTLLVYWNTLCLVRRRDTGMSVVPPRIKDAMIRQQLGQEFNLEIEKQAKPIVRAEDEAELLKTLWGSSTFTLDHERLRVQLALIAQLARITGNRPGALLALRYGDLKVALLRNTSGTGRPKVLLDFSFRKTKSYRGPKDPNTFPIPEVCGDSCLPICPQIVLLSLMFADKAFESPLLTGPDSLFQLRVPHVLLQLDLPIKESLRTVPVFRAVTQTAYGYEISPTAEATTNWLREQFKRWGTAAGFALKLKPYCFRRGNGEALDSRAHISDAQRNIILGHGSSGVFERNYLSRCITQDTQAVYRGLEPQTAVVRLASSMMRSKDARQPTSLTPAQDRDVNQYPELRLLLRTRTSLAARIRAAYGTVKNADGTELHSIFQSIRREYHQRQKALRRARLKEIKSRFRTEQALADIEQQLGCGDSAGTDNGDVAMEDVAGHSLDLGLLSDERRLAFTTLFAAATEESNEDWKRRSAAIDAITALCKRREPHRRSACQAKQAAEGDAPTQRTAYVHCPRFPQQCLPTQCIFCLGNTELAMEMRTKSFRDRYSLGKHFRSAHLTRLPEGTALTMHCAPPT
ncbi:hypothetical protein LTR56_020462 [Elasticomyces elasticus]|nr:hypothetical protein LTR56_020462 [Elasticomyces elasticus]KAK3645832.1 hypothetical protein LTR22_014600 [Elasticomyces elasticus]KAK5742301.1 hypothetical protein LTS12_024295 [Elasticomyces elasticus]